METPRARRGSRIFSRARLRIHERSPRWSAGLDLWMPVLLDALARAAASFACFRDALSVNVRHRPPTGSVSGAAACRSRLPLRRQGRRSCRHHRSVSRGQRDRVAAGVGDALASRSTGCRRSSSSAGHGTTGEAAVMSSGRCEDDGAGNRVEAGACTSRSRGSSPNAAAHCSGYGSRD